MNINTIGSYQSTNLYPKSSTVKTESSGEHLFSIPETVATKQKDSSTLYEELSSKYDVRNATFGELTNISQALYAAGEISLIEHATLTFDYERSTNTLKQHAPTSVSSNFSMYETSANSNGQRDWIAEFGARASKDFQFGNLVGYQTKSKILAILQKLDTK